MFYQSQEPLAAAAAGHLPPISAGFGTTAQPGTGGWVSGAVLRGHALMLSCQTGAFGTITGCQYKLRSATDANGTGAADVTGGAGPNITAANNAAQAELPMSLIDPSKWYAVACTVAGSVGAALVSATVGVLDPQNAV